MMALEPARPTWRGMLLSKRIEKLRLCSVVRLPKQDYFLTTVQSDAKNDVNEKNYQTVAEKHILRRR